MSKPVIDYTNVDYDGFKKMMIEGLKDTMPEYTDTSETDPGIIIIELLARGLDIINHYQNVQANECYLSTAERRENVNTWCDMLGYIPKVPTPAIHTEVIAISDLNTQIEKFTSVQTKAADSITQPIYFSTLDDLIQKNSEGKYTNLLGYELSDGSIVDTLKDLPEDDTRTVKNYLFLVPVVEGSRINDEQLGLSDGTENQEFVLNNSPAYIDEYDDNLNSIGGNLLEVSVSNSDGSAEYWFRVDNFMNSGSDDKHYIARVLENNSVQIIFGDNKFGKIPPANSVIRASYINGGGTKGNVGKFTITEMTSAVSTVSYLYNLEQGSEHSFYKGRSTKYADRLGTNTETIQSIRRNAPTHFRTLWGCISVEDYSAKLLELFTQVEFADSIKTPLTDTEDDNPIDGVDVYFVVRNPETQLLEEGLTALSATTLQQVRSMYEERQLVGTHVNLKKTTFLPLSITAEMYTFKGMTDTEEDKAIFQQTVTEVKEYLNYYFNKAGKFDYTTTASIIDIEADVVKNIDNVRSFRIKSVTLPNDLKALQTWKTDDVIIPCEHGQIISLSDVSVSRR